MTNKAKIIIAFIALLTAFAFGRYLAPTKTITVTHTIEVEKKTTDTKTDEKKHQKTVTKEIIKPDGTKETTTTTTESDRTKTDTSEKDQISKTTDQTKEVTRGGSRLTLSALGGVNVTGIPSITYGGMVQKDVLGPIGIGIWGLTNGTMGASIGLSF